MVTKARRRRDPEARRREIVEAAAELIVEIGVDALTHRKVAARACVPLGATTQYFDTLDDLRDAALGFLVREIELRIEATRQAVESVGVTPEALARLITESLADARALETDRAVVTAAVHDPRVRELARRWSDQVVEFIAPVHGLDRAKAAAVFIDGVLWHAQISDDPLEERLIRDGLAGILTPGSTAPAAFAPAAPSLAPAQTAP
ncbi:TetR/AcrR family transcriptional regulator [Microbacterium galbinum]|uniref:TetR family transcriptional regulator n=1 Tax=Microbacterium galbinum TaxID=2851646 RepID=A0ABY4IRU9_9MICO|nr:TetR family transcriptional regulator [Microbacterium galbinum]MCK2029666.1 TetR family transcriptional regulator [Microbacterium galbinum]UPL14561.1 TetR family transcriptional regulator [Microbacterium galbinum]